jgi:hypothetical protein
VAGAALSGSITLRDLDTDPVVDLALGIQHLDFAQLLGASGLAVPESLGMGPLSIHPKLRMGHERSLIRSRAPPRTN